MTLLGALLDTAGIFAIGLLLIFWKYYRCRCRTRHFFVGWVIEHRRVRDPGATTREVGKRIENATRSSDLGHSSNGS